MGIFQSIAGMIGGGSSGGGGNTVVGLPNVAGTAWNLGTQYVGNELFNKPAAEAQFHNAKDLAKYSFDLSYGAYKRRYQDTVADMIAAGINPIMAASGGFSVGPSPNVSAPSAMMSHAPDYQNYTTAAKEIAETGGIYEKQKETVMKTKEARARANEHIARTYVERARKGLITAQERQAVKTTQLLDKQIWVQLVEFQKKVQEGYKANAEKRLILKKINQLETVMAKLRSISDVYTTPYLGQFIAFLNSIMSLSGSAGAMGTMKMVK